MCEFMLLLNSFNKSQCLKLYRMMLFPRELLLCTYTALLNVTGTRRSHRNEITRNMEQRSTSHLWHRTGIYLRGKCNVFIRKSRQMDFTARPYSWVQTTYDVEEQKFDSFVKCWSIRWTRIQHKIWLSDALYVYHPPSSFVLRKCNCVMPNITVWVPSCLRLNTITVLDIWNSELYR